MINLYDKIELKTLRCRASDERLQYYRMSSLNNHNHDNIEIH